jgi:pimeloyl-ACP methyl ester carboxylesterase
MTFVRGTGRAGRAGHLIDCKGATMKTFTARLGVLTLGAALVTTIFAGSPAVAAPAADAPPPLGATRCAAFVGSTIDAGSIELPTTGAVVTAATWVVDPSSGGQCRVVGEIEPVDPTAPVIEFQVNLPEMWNHRALQFGGGGYDGSLVTATGPYRLQPAGQPTPLQQGFVTLGSDGGHKGVGFDASFGLNDEALRNYGQESIKKTHDAAIVLIDLAYGDDPDYFYFAGFSQGGHEALDAAGRYPKDYDGVIAGTPTYNVTMMHAGTGSMYRDALYRDGGIGWINPVKRALLVDSVYAACDPIDGLADGIISDTEGCLEAFDVQTLRCADGADLGDTCLSDAQIQTVNLIAAGKDLGFEIAGNSFSAPGPILTGGTYTRFGLGTAAQPNNPMNGTEAFQYTVLDAISKYIITRDPTLDTPNWDLEPWIPRIQEVGRIMDTTDVSFQQAFAKKVKVLMYTGMSDDGVSPYNTIQFYDRLVADLGEEKLDDFLRFYTIPGFSHGFGPFNASIDSLPALMAWVEDGEEPGELTTSDTNVATLGRTRPLCEYPAWPRFDGGDPDSAASFSCVTG